MGTLGSQLTHVLYLFVAACSRFRAVFSYTRKLHTARFARAHELQSLISTTVNQETSLLLGVTRFSQQVLRVRPQKTRRELGNVLVVAPPRSGKSILATSQLLTWPHSVIVNDIKGELFHRTAGDRSRRGPVFVIDPTGVGHRYDPLVGKHTEYQLLSVATNLLYTPDEGEGRVFTQRASGMLRELFLAARVEGIPPLPYVRQLIRKGPAKAAERLHTIDPELATRFLYEELPKANLQDKFLHSAWGTLWARMEPLLTETVMRTFTGTDFTANDVLCSDVPVTVYLRWTERDLLALSPLVRLLWSSLIDEMITTYDAVQGKGCHPVLLLVDEAGRTAIPNLAEYATTVVGRGISLWIAIQSLSQLDAVYGKAHAHILRDNMETQLYFRPTDQDTAEYLERCLGRTSAFASSQTKREGGEVSEGEAEQGVPLMTAWKIKQLKDEDILGFHRHLPPFRAKRMDWRKYPMLAARTRIPAPPLSPLPELLYTLPHQHSNGHLQSPQPAAQMLYGDIDPAL
jgi:type IV secretion system protein VirD4